MQKQEGAPRLRLRVTTAAETAVRAGHPWVFAESISEQNRDGKTGELAVIYDKRNKFLAAGLFDAESPIRVRVLHAGKPQTIDAGWWRARLASALERRLALHQWRKRRLAGPGTGPIRHDVGPQIVHGGVAAAACGGEGHRRCGVAT
jgi:nicotinamidase-related amidase